VSRFFLIPAIGITSLLKAVGSFAEDGLAETVLELFGDHPDREEGFDFEN
jgi:hypothetical protein